jgi:hypothetical protein
MVIPISDVGLATGGFSFKQRQFWISRERSSLACKRCSKQCQEVSFPEKLKESERFERFCKRFAGRRLAFPTLFLIQN